MPVTKDEYGRTSDGEVIDQYTITNKGGMKAKFIDYGASLIELWVPDQQGNAVDVVLGWPDLKGYENNSFYFASVVGRVANRIAKGSFSIDGVKYQLNINNGPNTNHGGIKSFHLKVWKGCIEGDDKVTLTYVSPDGEEGFPGEVTASVTYQLTDDNRLVISFVATTTKATPINLCNHSYFNLAGHKTGSIIDHLIQINAENYTPLDDTSVPTGEIVAVKDTVFDLREPVKIGDRIYDVPGLGFDHNFCIQSSLEAPCARVSHPGSGRCMEMFTTKPGIQLYSANYLDDTCKGKEGFTYAKHGGFCLESQYYPNSVNQPNFSKSVLRPGEQYNHTTVYKFAW
ncbi:galactose mutarotase-like [Lytechinus pictus]|uniref:galactose mutarotase-like n=1 Tax=Lytechinus pictus TaxID=7653 RepID=UPI0030B9CF0A